MALPKLKSNNNSIYLYVLNLCAHLLSRKLLLCHVSTCAIFCQEIYKQNKIQTIVIFLHLKIRWVPPPLPKAFHHKFTTILIQTYLFLKQNQTTFFGIFPTYYHLNVIFLMKTFYVSCFLLTFKSDLFWRHSAFTY